MRLTELKNFILGILFPPICLNCKILLQKEEKEGAICRKCLEKIFVHTALFCGHCRARLPDNKKICHKNAFFLLGAVTDYDETIKPLIHQLKYQSWTRVIAPLTVLLKNYLENLRFEETLQSTLKNCLIIPIPLHKQRQRERGFNQAELLGKTVSEILRLPMATGILRRIKKTKSQAALKNWEQRKMNLNGAFLIVAPEQIKGKNIVLVDDVFTSGATLNEASKTLRLAGAKRILALVAAKAR